MPLFIYENFVEYNVKKIKKLSKRNVIAVVKSNAYGINARKIVKILYNEVDIFAFEKYNEYMECEDILDNKQVLIMENIIYENVISAKDNVIFTINSMLDMLKLKNINKKIKVHLRIDTGMNRLGIRSIPEYKKILELIKENEKIIIDGIYTHFSSGLEFDKYYDKQMLKFKKYLKYQKYNIIHANASKSLHKELIGTHVRIGMSLYGYHQPFYKLKKVLSLKVKPISIFRVSNVDKIGYFQKNSPSGYVGVINLGYNDINLDNIEYFYIKDKKYKILGKSCMNHTHFTADDKINYLSWLSILPTNDIISSVDDYKSGINWYYVLTSIKHMPKNFFRRSNYDVPKIFKTKKGFSFKKWIRGRSN